MKRMRLQRSALVLVISVSLTQVYGAVQKNEDFNYTVPGVYKQVTLGNRTGDNEHSGQPITFGTYKSTVTDPKTGQTHNAGEPIAFSEKWSDNIYYGIDLADPDTEYTVYVPESYGTNHSEPHGIILYYSSNDGAKPATPLEPLLEERKLIHIGANGSGNGTWTDYRIGVGLMGLVRAMELFNIDTDRIYLSGSSGGSRTLHALSFYHPELFSGCLGMVGSGYPEYLPNCYETRYENSHYEVGYISHWNNVGLKYYPREVGFRYFCNTAYGDWRQGDNMNVYHFGLERNGFINRLYSAEGGHANGRTTMDFKAGIDFLEHPREAFDASLADLSDAGASALEAGQTLTLTPTASASAAAQTENRFNWCDPYGAEIRFQYKPHNNSGGVLNQKTDIGIWSAPFESTDALPTSDYAANDRAGLILSLVHDGSEETFSLRFVQPNHTDPTMRDLTLCTGSFTDWPNESALWDNGGWSGNVNQSINTSNLNIRINAWEDEVDLVFGKHLTVDNDKNLDYVDRLDDQRTIRLRFNADDHHNDTDDVFHTLMLSSSDWFRKNQCVMTFASQAPPGGLEPGTATIRSLSLIYSGDVDVPQSIDPIIRGPLDATVSFNGALTNEVVDPNGESLTFSKLSGPDWLVVETNGLIHGTPDYMDGGTNVFNIKATDPGGLSVEPQLQIDVVPHFIDPVDLSATVDVAFSDDLSNYVTNSFEYELLDGPDWLTIGSDGSLSGTPLEGDVGSNHFTVQLSSGGSFQHLLSLAISVEIDVLMVDTNADDDDTATAQTTYDLGPADLAGAWAELNDSEGMSLREALWFANKAEGTDDIVFDLSADTWNDMTITLTNGTRLVIDSPVIIDGGSGIVIDANHESRVMYINDGNGDGDTTVVKLKNLTISGGDGDKSTETASGAGIYNDEILTLENCTVRDNKVIGGNGNWQDGIGIKNTGQLTLLNSRVLNNTSTYKRSRGGGISAGGTVYIINSIVADNAVSAGGRTHGGGIWFTGDELIIVNSSIYGNICGVAEDGCGIKNVGTTLEIYSSIIAGNKQGSVLTNNITGGAEITSSLVGDNVIFDGSTWIDGGSNIIGTDYATEVFDGSFTNSGTDLGAIIYSDGTNYDTDDNGGTYSRVTPYVDAKGYVRVSGAGVDIGAHEIQVSESGESYYSAWATNQNLSGTNAAYDVDADGDGLNNFLEYIYGGDPQSPVGAVAHRPRLRKHAGQGQGAPYDGLKYTFRFRRGAAQRQLSYTAENSLKLGAGASWSTCTNIQTTPINEDIEEVSVYLPASNNVGFIKVNCTLTL